MTSLLAGCLLLLTVAPVSGASQAASPTTEYIVGSQDVLTIMVFDEAQLTGRYTVESDGTFIFPWIGRIAAKGMTLRGIEERLTKLLADGYLTVPQVTVLVEHYRSQNVFIMGEVRTPGKYALTGSMTLIEALAQAGWTSSTASNEVLIVHPKEQGAALGPLMPDDNGNADVVRVNLKELQAGRLSSNVAIQDGDTIFVPKAETFFITGHVRNPGSYVMERGITVLQAISLAGGISDRGSTRRIKVLRVVDGKKQDIGVKLTDLVQPGDTVVVPQRFF